MKVVFVIAVLMLVASTYSAGRSIQSVVDSMIFACNNSQCMCCDGAEHCLCRDNIQEAVRCTENTGLCSSNAFCTLIPSNHPSLPLRFQCGCLTNLCDDFHLTLTTNSTSPTLRKDFCKGGKSSQNSSTVQCLYTFDHKFNTSYSSIAREHDTRWGLWSTLLNRGIPNITFIKDDVVRYNLQVGGLGILTPKKLVSLYTGISSGLMNKQSAFIGNPQPFMGGCSDLSCSTNEVCLDAHGTRKCTCTNDGGCPTETTPSTTATTMKTMSSQSTMTSQLPIETATTTTVTEVEQPPPDDQPQLDDPPLPTSLLTCPGNVEMNDGECYHTFDQKFIWNETYDKLDDKELYQKLQNSIHVTWKPVYDVIKDSVLFIDGWVLRSHLVVRYQVVIGNVNWTSQDLLNKYKETNIDGKLGLIYGYPAIYSDNCSDVAMSCGINTKCTMILGIDECLCQDGFHGDPLVECFAFCPQTRHKNFTFPQQWVGLYSLSLESCPKGFPKASLPCEVMSDGKADFDLREFTTIDCSQTVDGITSQVNIETLTETKIEEYAVDLLLLTSNQSTISNQDLQNISNFVQIVNDGVKQGKTNISSHGFLSITSLSSQLLSSLSYHGNQEVGNTLTRSLSDLSVRSTMKTNESSIVAETSAMMVNVLGERTIKPGEKIIFQPVLRTFQSRNHTQPIRVEIPAKVADNVWGIRRRKRDLSENNQTMRAAFIFYKDDAFFKANVDLAYVVSVDIGVNAVLSNLEEPVGIEHLGVTAEFGQNQVQGNDFRAVRTTLSCKYWDYSDSSWKSDGCCLNSSSSLPQCLCNHLTNFALLVQSEVVPHDVALSIVSDVGLTISVLAMVATAIVIAISPDLRKHRSGKILIHICLNLSISYIIFVACVSSVKVESACIAVAALLQYFFLVSWCWMSVYSYDMYISLVKVFSKYRSRFLLKATFLCYGIPLVIVTITLIVTIGYFDQKHETVYCDGSYPLRRSYYLADNMCWIKDYSLYFGFLAPIGLFLLYNCFVFVVVTIELNKHNKEVQSLALRRTTKQSLLLAATMVVVLGITWIFAYLMLISDDSTYLTVTSWIFTIFCSLQGLGIFLLTTVRREDMRKVWFAPLTRCCGVSPSTPTTASKSTGTSRVRTSSNNADQVRSSTG